MIGVTCRYKSFHARTISLQGNSISAQFSSITFRGITMRHSMHLEQMMKRPLLLAVIATFAVAGCSHTPPAQQVSYEQPREEFRSLVGPRGADGPAGPVGMQGPVGATGAMGAPLAGPTGADGPAGAAGIQGPVGATGPRGIAVVGPAGATGAAGPAGAQGAIGNTGAQGASIAGPAGAMGNAGPAGVQGVAGSMGAEGPTLVGPAGPVGRTGIAGGQGATGFTGAQGNTEMAGIAGPTGRSGNIGPQGSVGPTGAQGPIGTGAMGNAVVSGWTFYRDYTFNRNSDDILRSDSGKAREIADYLNQNPSARVSIDGPNQRYVHSVREELAHAGVPASKIQIGAYDDSQKRADHRVVVMVSN
jgi:hypothetical protein